jgi:hypothetical protein
MRKYPEHIATKQDVLNIINNHPEYHSKLKTTLSIVVNEPDKCEQIVSCDTDPETHEMFNIVTKHIAKPILLWQRMGFNSRDELVAAITKL